MRAVQFTPKDRAAKKQFCRIVKKFAMCVKLEKTKWKARQADVPW
jgi:hypothetical protein